MRSELDAIMDEQEILRNRLVEFVKKQIKEIAFLKFGEKDAEAVTIGDYWNAYLDEYGGDKVYSLDGKGVYFHTYEGIYETEYDDINYTHIKNLVFDLEQCIANLKLQASKNNK